MTIFQIGSSVYICYKKSMRQVDSISFKAGDCSCRFLFMF